MTEIREIQNMPEGEQRAAALHKVANAALAVVGSIENDPFPHWRIRHIRKVRSRARPYSNEIGWPTADEMEQALSLCRDLAPTPHEKMEYGGENDGESHPNHTFGEAPVALRPLVGDDLPAPAERE